jgi:hypothetical protein
MKYIIVSRIGKLNSAELESEDEFSKKYKIKLMNGYQLFHTWECYLDGNIYGLQLYTKLSGKLINKYKFPPPFDKQSFNSECIFTCVCNQTVIDLELDLCNSLLNTLNKKDLYEDTELIPEEYDYSETT